MQIHQLLRENPGSLSAAQCLPESHKLCGTEFIDNAADANEILLESGERMEDEQFML